MELKEERKKLEILNLKLLFLCESYKIESLSLIAFGNSIASGASMVRKTQPILYRNPSLVSLFKSNGIAVNLVHFARAQNNEDKCIRRWILNDIKETDIFKMNRKDYQDEKNIFPTTGLTREQINIYYPLEKKPDLSIQDVLFQNGEHHANLVFYFGCTGNAVKRINQQSSFSDLLWGIQEDAENMENNVYYIQDQNLRRRSNTQVYLCGAPNPFGVGLTSPINYKIKQIAKKYPHTVYVPPVRSKLYYRSYQATPPHVTGCFQRDIHYDEIEYLTMYNHMLDSVIRNYGTTKKKIEESYQKTFCKK